MGKPVKVAWLFAVDLSIWVIMITAVAYVLLLSEDIHWQIAAAGSVVICALVHLALGGNGGSSTRVQANAGFRKPAEPRDIVKLVQIDEDGEPVKEWYIMGQTSLLIGKSNPMQEVEIDLADSEYASLISSVHAVLNRVNQEWFIEDNDSASGTGVRAASRSTAMKLQSGEPCRINSGDLLYIANTRLLVK
ncbi:MULTISPECIES: FHA domain-containing protein [unclassified Paenibacillus]|uniref:FHA domain-containing protein n=1 Tax=unclassified Paenibacillus TaxID=185978 RepID=UPI0020D02E14|nr:FHA domain-containing protein [Paenibacillus sp. 7541]